MLDRWRGYRNVLSSDFHELRKLTGADGFTAGVP